jgi:hypothetical protein
MVKRAAGLVVAVPFDLVSQPRKDGSSAEYFDLILRSRWPRYESRSHPQDLRTRLSATEEDKFGLFQEMSCERSSRGNVAHMKGNLGGAVHVPQLCLMKGMVSNCSKATDLQYCHLPCEKIHPRRYQSFARKIYSKIYNSGIENAIASQLKDHHSTSCGVLVAFPSHNPFAQS